MKLRLAMLFACLCLPFQAPAALAGSLSGRLRAALSRQAISAPAKVWAKNRRGKRFEGKAEAGRYVIEGLPWGAYTLFVEAEGYSRLTRTGVRLASHAVDSFDLELEPLPKAQK